MLIDVGVNLLNRQFDRDRPAVMKRAVDAGVSGMLVTATDLSTTAAAVELCCAPDLFCTAGVHPHDAAVVESDWLEQLTELAGNSQVRAIGETGLDFNRNYSPPDVQLDIFRAQIRLAQEINKPLFVHDRESDGEVLHQLQSHSPDAGPLPPVVIHCFTGTQEELASYLGAGFYIGITGWVTEPQRGAELRDLVAEIPLHRLLIETDAPFLRPSNTPPEFMTRHNLPAKLKRRCEPALLPYVLDVVATHRPEEPLEVLSATAANARALFGFS